jgi:small subunit ribosomal protein S6
MVVLDPNLDEAGIEAVNTRLQTLVTQRGGSVDTTEAWGRKRLAYPIGRHRDGVYVLSRLQLPPTAADEVKRSLKLNESVIRYLLIRAEDLAAAPAPVPARA